MTDEPIFHGLAEESGMPLSQNGLSANDRSVIRSVVIPGTDVKVAVRIGPVGDLLLYVAARWHREVEPLRAPDGVLDCWGYAERTIRGSTTELSNHASGSALDFRARDHPLGTDPAANYTSAEIAAIRRIVADCRGAIRWGGDYTGRKDGMHVETIATEARCAEVFAAITQGGTPTVATIDDVARKLDLLKPGVKLPARSANCRATSDDHFGATLHAWAEAADARALVQQLLVETRAVRADLAEVHKHLDALGEHGPVDPSHVLTAIRAAVTEVMAEYELVLRPLDRDS